MKPKFIYFDLGNVLLTFDYKIACRQMAEVSHIEPEQVQEIIFDSDLQLRYESGQLSGPEFYEIFCREAQEYRDDSPDAPAPDYTALRWAGSAMFELNSPIIPIVAHLKSARLRLGILSNTCEAHWEYCMGKYVILDELFGVYVLSYEVGAVKPDAKIYRVAAERASVAPEEIFFTDDRPEHVAGARAAGFDAVQFTSARNLADALRERGVRFNY